MKKQNFVLFFPDEMRASSVSCYGNPTVEMENFDRFAANGTLFENCIVQNPVCSPSRCSLMTGLYVHNLGHRTLWHLLRPHEPSLFRYLKNDGYQIQWYGKNDLYSQEYLDEICDDVDEIRNGYQNEPSMKTGLVHWGENPYPVDDDRYYSFLFNPLPESEDFIVDVYIARAVDFIMSRTENDKPFMLYLPTLMPHPVYNALKSFHEKYSPEEVIDQLYNYDDKTDPPAYMALIREYRRAGKWTKEFIAKIYAVYLGMNSYVDKMLGLVMDALEKKGLMDNTTVIVSSDHGDWAGNFGLVEKWPNAMEDDIVKVPLMIQTPGGEKGNRIKGQVALFDIMPTILEIAGVPCQHTHFAVSLTSELKGERDDLQRPTFCEGGYDAHEPHCFEDFQRGATYDYLMNPASIYYPKAKQQRDVPESVCRSTMLRTNEFKLVIRTNGDNQLYDLQNDPEELVNLYRNESFERERLALEKQMLAWYIKTSDVVPTDDDLRGFTLTQF